MNDFTIEELQLLANSINFWNMQTDEPVKDEILLSIKIQSMIDKYCEHVSNL